MLSLMRQLNEILPRTDKIRLIILFGLMLIAAAFEIVGISLVLIFVSFVSTPEKIAELSKFGLTDQWSMLMWGSGGIFLLFIVKNLYLSFYYYLQARFVHNKFKNISFNLYKNYMYAPYLFHIKNNSSILIRNVTVETYLLLRNVMIPLLNIGLQIIMILGIVGFLLFVDPKISLIVLVLLGGVGGLLLSFLKTRSQLFGKLALENRRQMIQRTNEGLSGFKEIVILNKQSWFIQKFKESIQNLSKAETFNEFSKQIFKPVMETIAVLGMLTITLVLFRQTQNLQAIIPTLGLFGVATLKLLPAITRLASEYNKLRYYGYTLKPIHQDLIQLDTKVKKTIEVDKGAKKTNLKKTIELKGIYYRYPDNIKPLFKNLSLTIKKGEAVGLVGVSGVGKTTIVDLLIGLLKPNKGEVLVDGENINNNLAGWQKNIGYIPQTIYLSDDTIGHNIAYGLEQKKIDKKQLKAVIKAAQLDSLIKGLPQGIKTKVGERGVRLSGGQRQRIGIARALYSNPDVLIMDEATSSLDNQTESYIINAIEKLRGKKTIIIIAHRLTTVKHCDNLFFIKNGKVAIKEKYQHLLKKNDDFKKMIDSQK